MKTLLIISALLSTSQVIANCENEELKIQVNITSSTFDQSYEDGEAYLSNGENISVLEKSTNQEFVFEEGIFYNDGAGNFTIEAKNFLTSDIYVDHDHETWHTDGLSGGFTSPIKDYDLSSLKCSFDDLFVIY